MWLLIILTTTLASSLSLFLHHSINRQKLNLFSQLMMLLVFLSSLLSVFFIPMSSQWQYPIPLLSDFNLTIDLYYDSLTWIMLCLVTFVSLMMHSYAARYLLSDQNQMRFISQLSLLTFSVMLLIMSGGLLTAFIAWQFTGLSLYLLLNHYHYDVKANKAAKKKFMINRVGDICFLLAVILTFLQYGSTEFSILFELKAQTHSFILALIFVAIMTKSAQFPFHIWLIDTMEAPTPVSAMMHAGVINAGGFLLARLSPLYEQKPDLLLFVFSIGFITALLGSYFMQSQPDVKKKLAYSTMGQMGYMVMQCGLGCFVSAVFHLIAHGFFKASLFLSSGSTLKHTNLSQPDTTLKLSKSITAWIKSIILTTLLIGLGVIYFSQAENYVHLNPLLWFFIAISLTQLFYKALSQLHSRRTKSMAIFLITLLACFYLISLQYFDLLLGQSIAEMQLLSLGWLMVIMMSLAILVYFCLSHSTSPTFKRRLFSSIYWISFNKLYIEKLYRSYLINPMRRLGDILLNSYLKASVFKKNSILVMLLAWLILTIIYCSWFSPPVNGANNIAIVTINLILLILVFLIANRVETLSQLLMTLLLTSFIFVSLTLAMGETDIKSMGYFQLLNNLLLFAGFALLLLKRRDQISPHTLVQNRLPWCHFYMSVFLMLLIGIPGTSSFVSEFYLLESLLQIHMLFAVILGGGMLLLTLVVLHTLQTHFFNPKAINQHAILVSPRLHIICLLIIGFNLFNGVYPLALLQLLNSIQSV